MFKSCLFIILLSLSTGLMAQDDIQHEMRLLARPLQDSIVLRWAPTTYQLWLNGNEYGYHITRTTLIKNGKYIRQRTTRLTKQPLKPRPLAEWEALVENNAYAGVAAQAIYGDGFEVEAGEGESGMVEMINRSTEQENRFGFALFAADQSPEVARYSALWLTDKKVKPGEKYLYKVFPAQVAEGVKQDTAVFFTGVDEYMPLTAPANVKAEAGDKMVTITWDKQYQSDLYNSYWIERSADKGQSFQRLNEVPLVNTTPEGHDEANFHFYVDSLPDNETAFQYRVLGISVFGELSPASKVVSAKGIYKISSVPKMTAKAGLQGQTVVLNWAFANEKQEKVDGFRIYRSVKFDSDFTLIGDRLPIISQQYTDQTPLPNAYYRIQAFNHSFDGPQSIPLMVQLVDSIPPKAPTGLQAEADTSGLVCLQWAANTEKDIFGYRVYRANSSREEFSQLTSEAVRGNVYMDTINLKTLSKEVYYKVVAIDKRQNKSRFSEVLKVERPDIVPPASPVFRKAKADAGSILLHWVQSPSRDVDKQVIYRNAKGSHEWTVVSALPADSIRFRDTPAGAGTVYRYIILAVDEAGNESDPAKPVAVKYHGQRQKDQWINPEVKYNKRKGQVALSWEKPPGGAKAYWVYEKKKDQWELLQVVASNMVVTLSRQHLFEYKILVKSK